MRHLKRFSILIALVNILMSACTQGGSNSSAPGQSTPSSPSSSASAKSPYYGAVDKRDCETVAGWVTDIGKPEIAVNVELYIDNKLIETIPAQNLRPDLVKSVGTGRYGFSFNIPSAYKDGRPHTIKIGAAGSGYQVPFLDGVFASFECKPA